MFYIRWHNDKLIFHANKVHTKKNYKHKKGITFMNW